MDAPDWKPRQRTVASPAWWSMVQTQKTGRCQCCQRNVGSHKTSWHHLVGRDLGGDDVIENLAELCGDGTTGCHGLVQELDRAACSRLRRNLRPDQVGYIVGRKGPGFYDRYFPP